MTPTRLSAGDAYSLLALSVAMSVAVITLLLFLSLRNSWSICVHLNFGRQRCLAMEDR